MFPLCLKPEKTLDFNPSRATMWKMKLKLFQPCCERMAHNLSQRRHSCMELWNGRDLCITQPFLVKNPVNMNMAVGNCLKRHGKKTTLCFTAAITSLIFVETWNALWSLFLQGALKPTSWRGLQRSAITYQGYGCRKPKKQLRIKSTMTKFYWRLTSQKTVAVHVCKGVKLFRSPIFLSGRGRWVTCLAQGARTVSPTREIIFQLLCSHEASQKITCIEWDVLKLLLHNLPFLSKTNSAAEQRLRFQIRKECVNVTTLSEKTLQLIVATATSLHLSPTAVT